MRHKMQALAGAVAAAVILQVSAAAGQNAVPVDVTGVPGGTMLELALNGGKIADGTAAAGGSTAFTVGLDGERRRVTVWVDQCKDGKLVRVQFVLDGNAEPPKDEDCDRKLAGWFWSNARRVSIDARAGTVRTTGRISTRTLAIAGGAAAGGGLLILAGGGDDNLTIPNNTVGGNQPGQSGSTFTPAGNYQSQTAVKTDPANHFPFIELFRSGLLTITGLTTLTVAGPPGSNWVTVTGTFDTSTNRFVLTGRGVVAGRSNVGVRFEGSITNTAALSGDYTMGTGSELPGGQPIVYSVTGQRQ